MGIKDERAWCLPFAIYNGANTAVEIQFALMVSVPYPPFHARERREQLRERLEAAVGISIDPGRLEKRPTFPLSVLHESGRFDAFIEVFEWTLDQALREGIGVGRHAEWREGLTRSAACSSSRGIASGLPRRHCRSAPNAITRGFWGRHPRLGP